jgi:LPXTG-site transpeptidase (sortase) family protein
MKLDPTHQPTFPLPTGHPADNNDSNAAADLIRHKLDTIYQHEPDVITETIESTQATSSKRSKHQKFMMELAASGKPFAVIQTEWHEYYTHLPDKEKHEVWEEFYSAQNKAPVAVVEQPAYVYQPDTPKFGSFEQLRPAKPSTMQSVGELKNQITSRVVGRGTLTRKQHIKSIGFGLGIGSFAILLMLFGLFNEKVIAPFITPSRNVSSTPLIIDPLTSAVGQESRLIIPKINVEVPVVYDVETVEESAVQSGLERGVVHYATTSNPGEQGNGAIFGHSSNNILNRGRYKFAFVLLSRLEIDDTFYVERSGVRYVYKIFEKKIVSPNEVGILGDIPGKTSTMTLITCDPPGTTISRLVVVGEQISPDPTDNIASTALKTDVQVETLAGNPQSLWSRIWGGIF